MSRREPVGVIHPTFFSGSGSVDGLEFIRCVGGRQPQIQEFWSFAEDGNTCEVHLFAPIDVCDFSRDCFRTDYVTEIGRRVFIYVQKYINGSVEWLGVSAPF